MALKIIYTNNVDIGLPDHLVEKLCRSVLERLRKHPNNLMTHRTGQKIVWQTFKSLLTTDYSILADQVEFEDKTNGT